MFSSNNCHNIIMYSLEFSGLMPIYVSFMFIVGEVVYFLSTTQEQNVIRYNESANGESQLSLLQVANWYLLLMCTRLKTPWNDMMSQRARGPEPSVMPIDLTLQRVSFISNNSHPPSLIVRLKGVTFLAHFSIYNLIQVDLFTPQNKMVPL